MVELVDSVDLGAVTSGKGFPMETILDRVEIGIEKYNWIMKRVHETDVSSDVAFQRVFNGF